jgi:hypothetical protein
MENQEDQSATQQKVEQPQVEVTEAPKPAEPAATPAAAPVATTIAASTIAAAPAAATVTAAPAPVVRSAQPAAPAKPAGLFRPADPTAAKPQPSESDQYSIEGELLQTKAPTPKPAPVVDDSAPVFRVVPLPDVEPENEKEHAPAMELGHSSSNATGKNHEVLHRVKGMLVKQEQTIKVQQKKIESMRADIAKMSRQLDELRSKTTVDDQSIAELAEFLQEHEGDENPARKSEAA